MSLTASPMAILQPDDRLSPLGVIDIGSNSVRLVVFDALQRAAIPLFNEKVLCGLGAGLERTGRLNPEGWALALETLSHFSGLAEAMQVSRLELLATAAVRDAEDGAAFVREAEARSGHRIRVLTGEEEARLSALGVLSGLPEHRGLMGDLGGGSLELVELRNGSAGRWASLPLGPFRLMDAVGDDLKAARELIDHQLARVEWLDQLQKQDFHAVGGTWRALAQLQMARTRYPLHMVQGYALPRADAKDATKALRSEDQGSLKALVNIPPRRAEMLPLAGLLLARILKRAAPARVIFSSRGLREGWLFDQLPAAEQAADPLLLAAR